MHCHRHQKPYESTKDVKKHRISKSCYLDCVIAITQLHGVLVIITSVISKLAHLMLEIWFESQVGMCKTSNLEMVQVRVGLHHEPWRRTMEDGLFSWSNLMVQLSRSYLKINKFMKPLGPSLGVNRMWTKRNDHAPKNECVGLIDACPKKAVLKPKKWVWPFFCLLLSSFSSLQKKFHQKLLF